MAGNMPPPSQEYLNESKASYVLAIITVFPSLAAIVVSLRLYTRWKIVHSASWEDYAILGALIFSIATSICQGFQVYNGMGRHIQALTLEQGIGSLKALFASIMMYNFGLTLTKTSIVLQYLRIAVDKNVRRWCWMLFWVTIFNSFQTFMTGIFSCYPVPKFWDDRIPGGCVNKPALWYANAAINIIQDIWLIVLPILILRKLALPRREKISLIIILGLGGFASCASVFRLHALYLVAISKDITWDNPGTATWSAMELNIGIICASLPTLRALLAKYFPRMFRAAVISRAKQQGAYQSSASDHQKYACRAGNSGTFDETLADGAILIKSEIDVDVEQGQNSFLASDLDADQHSLQQQNSLSRPEPMQVRR